MARNLPPRMRLVKGRFYWYGCRDGKRTTVPLGADYRTALARWADLEGRLESGSVADAIERYRARALPALAESTQRKNAYELGVLAQVFGHMQLADVRPHHIAAYLEQHHSPVSANRHMAVLSAVFEKAMRWGLIDHNPTRGVRRNPERPRDRYVTAAEFDRLKDAAEPHWRAVLDLAYLTAMRRGDLITLPMNAAGDEGIAVRQSKTGRRQVFEWTPTLRATVDALKATRRAQVRPTLVAKKNGRPYRPEGFSKTWRLLRERAGLLDVRFHDIRGTALTDATRAHGIGFAQALGGHHRQATTEGYVAGRRSDRVRPLR